MNSEEFKAFGRDSLDYIADYFDNIRQRRVMPSVEPGFLREVLPDEAPAEPEPWTAILPDLERAVMPGWANWQSPRFNAFCPSIPSFASVVGELLTAGIQSLNFTWESNPAGTELEVLVMDWLGKMLGVPQEFLNSSPGPGGGILQGSASEATFMMLVVAKEEAVERVNRKENGVGPHSVLDRLVAYTSEQSNSSVERAGLLGSVVTRLLPTDCEGRLTAGALEQAVQDDLQRGLVPFFVTVTLGTTSNGASDHLSDIGPLCRRLDLWLHVDAAYAGCAYICEEFRKPMEGLEFADSITINPHKLFMVNIGCTAHWIKDSRKILKKFKVNREYLGEDDLIRSKLAPDLRHWQVPLGRPTRAIKLWITLRLYGVSGMQEHIRRQVALARRFADKLVTNPSFKLLWCNLGIVCFTVEGDNEVNKAFLERINNEGVIYMVGGKVNNTFFLRYVVTARQSTEEDIDLGWNHIEDVHKRFTETQHDKQI